MMNHPLALQALGDAHRADLLDEARRSRLAHAARGRGPASSQFRPALRLRHGLATTMAATALATTLLAALG